MKTKNSICLIPEFVKEMKPFFTIEEKAKKIVEKSFKDSLPLFAALGAVLVMKIDPTRTEVTKARREKLRETDKEAKYDVHAFYRDLGITNGSAYRYRKAYENFPHWAKMEKSGKKAILKDGACIVDEVKAAANGIDSLETASKFSTKKSTEKRVNFTIKYSPTNDGKKVPIDTIRVVAVNKVIDKATNEVKETIFSDINQVENRLMLRIIEKHGQKRFCEKFLTEKFLGAELFNAFKSHMDGNTIEIDFVEEKADEAKVMEVVIK